MGLTPGEMSKELWFVRRGDEVRGPYPWTVVARDIGLGRINATDRLSCHQDSWLSPQDILAGALRFRIAAGSACDERGLQRRTQMNDARVEQRAGEERRALEDRHVVDRRVRAERVWAGLSPQARSAVRIPLLVIVLTLSVSLGLATHLSLPAQSAAPDCRAPAATKVNWDFCAKPNQRLTRENLAGMSARNAQLSGGDLSNADLRGADFAYADLSATDFTLADAGHARLVGASLRKAVFNHARLVGADLSFADLSGASMIGADLRAAHLGNTIWHDGRVCADDSIGTCNAQ